MILLLRSSGILNMPGSLYWKEIIRNMRNVQKNSITIFFRLPMKKKDQAAIMQS